MRVAILARVSTKDQQSIPMQIEAAQQYCKSRGWEIVKEIEEKQSGKRSLRPMRGEIIELAKKGKIDVVIVWKLNRWGRDTIDILMTINELFANPKLNDDVMRRLQAGQTTVSISGQQAAKTGEF